MLHGNSDYQAYLDAQFEDRPRYYSAYIRMEVMSGFIGVLIEFFHTASLPEVATFADAVDLWSQRFEPRQIKSIQPLLALMTGTGLDSSKPEHKNELLVHIASIIIRYVAKLNQLCTDVGVNPTHCGRAAISFNPDLANIPESFEQFKSAFNDFEACRSQCQIDRFLSNPATQAKINKYLDHLAPLSEGDTKTSGFQKNAKVLAAFQNKPYSECTCRLCMQMGDAIIALSAPTNMRLEHTDKSFNLLCDLIQLPHHLHPSVQALQKQKRATMETTTDTRNAADKT